MICSLLEREKDQKTDVNSIIQQINLLLKEGNSKMSEIEMEEGNTPLHLAFKYMMQPSLIDHLLLNKAELTERNFKAKTPFHLGIENQNLTLKFLKFMIEKKCDPKKSDARGNNALHLFAKNKLRVIKKKIQKKNKLIQNKNKFI